MDVQKYKENGYFNRDLYWNKWKDDSPKKLVAVYRTNFGEHLEESLEQTSKFADKIIIHAVRVVKNEDRRKDYSKLLKHKFPKIYKIEFYDGIFQEDYERNWLLQEALKTKGVNTHKYCGLISLKETPLKIQRKLRDEWE